MLGMSVHGNGLWLRKARFLLISLCVKLHEVLVKFETGFLNTSKDRFKLLVSVILTGKAKHVME